MNRILSIAVSAAMLFSMSAVSTFAADIDPSQEQTQEYTYDAPTSPVSVDSNIITATAHRAASPVLGILGLNAKSGFGMINGGAPSDLADAKTRAALGVWGTSINDNPDPYYWNYFYNFYAAENGKELSNEALVNADVAASPAGADNNLREEYGNVSYSLSTRPQIVVGCAASGAGGTDTSGYDGQLETIHSFAKDSPYYQEGDENYNPKLVAYQMTTIKNMIETVKTLADAVDEVAQATGQTTRYGDVKTIAQNYEDFVYGTVAYTLSELEKAGKEQKTVAIVLNINEDGTYLIADEDSTSATSVVRAHEYVLDVSKNLSDTAGTKGSATVNGRETTGVIVTLDELLTADALITINNNNISRDAIEESFGSKSFDGVIISNTPSALYGVTMNSVENAVGMAYVIGSLYSDTIDINPVELYAYWCEKFLHISNQNSIQKVVQTNFAKVILPKGISATLGADYSSARIDEKIQEGKVFYYNHKNDFKDYDDKYIGIDEWDVTSDEVGVPALTVSIQTGSKGEASAVKEYKLADLAALKETKEDGYGYVYYKGDAANATVATEYITLDALLKDAGVTFEAGDKLSFICADGPYTKGDFSYATMSQRGVDMDGNPVPSALAVKWNNGSLADGSVADIAKTAKDTGSLRFVSGMTTEEKENATAAGNRMPSGVVNLVVVKKKTFDDVVKGSFYENAVDWAVDKGVTEGTTDTTFEPGTKCNRAQMVTFLYRAAGSPEVDTADNKFVDAANEKAYYYKPVLWAVKEGITMGKDEQHFAPEDQVTRAEAVTFMNRMKNETASTTENPFEDLNEKAFYYNAVLWAAEKGIAKGMTPTTFEPNTICSRAEIVTFLFRYLG